MNRLKPFFSYYGSKWKLAAKYPRPVNQTIIEPFAGSACYSLLYPEHPIVLYDTNEYVCGVWEYLIGVSEKEILALPTEFESTDDLSIPQEAKWLIGFWIARANDRPKKKPSEWRNRWNEQAKQRIAVQLQHIRHWEIYQDSYESIPNFHSTWFIDPPYNNPAGRKYKENNIDFEHLSNWIQIRIGQVIVCEQEGANWLDFKPLASQQGFRGCRNEVVYTITNHRR